MGDNLNKIIDSVDITLDLIEDDNKFKQDLKILYDGEYKIVLLKSPKFHESYNKNKVKNFTYFYKGINLLIGINKNQEIKYFKDDLLISDKEYLVYNNFIIQGKIKNNNVFLIPFLERIMIFPSSENENGLFECKFNLLIYNESNDSFKEINLDFFEAYEDNFCYDSSFKINDDQLYFKTVEQYIENDQLNKKLIEKSYNLNKILKFESN